MAFLLDARIRKVSDGKKSLDDLLREGLRRYSPPNPGFTPEQFLALTSEIAGADMSPWFHKTLDTTDELDYAEALDHFGLRFNNTTDLAAGYTLEPRPNATDRQKENLQRLISTPFP